MKRFQMKKARRKPRGVALLMLSYVTAIMLSTLVFSFMSRQMLNNRYSGLYAEREQAYFLAESGIERMMDWIRKNPNTANAWLQSGTNITITVTNNVVTVTGDSSVATDTTLGWGSQAVGNGTVQVSVYKHATIPDLYLIISQGTVPSDLASGRIITQVVRSWVSVGNFARFAYFALASPNASTWIGTGNRFTGPVHFNGNIQVRGHPVFGAAVSTSTPSIIYPGGTQADGVTPIDTVNNTPDYQAGVPQINAAPQPFPAALPPTMKTHAQANGTYWNVPTTVYLETNGTMTVTNSVLGTPPGTPVNMSLPSNGVVFVDAPTVQVSGTLQGKLTVATTGEIVVTNHIDYDPSNDPVVNGRTSTDSLALVANGAVRVATSAPSDEQLNATVMSITDGLKIDGVEDNPPTVGNKGILHFYGSLLEYQGRPKRRTDGSGNTTSGYAGQYIYNPNAAITDGAPDVPNGNPTELSRERL